jgi:hypothetical protein
MKLVLSLILLSVLVTAFATAAVAQETGGDTAEQNKYSAEQSVAELRAQLLDVQSKEAELQARERQLNESLKPENIERSLAGVGSTRPEELREQVRRQLTIERDGVRTQLRLVTTSRERLEGVIRTAEALAYQQSAQETTLLGQALQGKFVSLRWIIGAASLLAVLGIVIVVAVVRRQKLTT